MCLLQNARARQKGLPIEDRGWKQKIDRPHEFDQGFSGPVDTQKRHAARYQEVREGCGLGLLKERASRRHPMQNGQLCQPVERGGGYPTEPRSFAQSRAGGRR